MDWLIKSWYQKTIFSWLLLPLTFLYQGIISLRRLAYEREWFTRHKMPVPVIIVGNISVGGTGKTPFVIWLVEQLHAAGFKPGVISRGYGGKSHLYPLDVSASSSARQVGDEPLLIANRAGCPVVVDPQRSRAAVHLLSQYHCDVIISDDGLQHYALQRDIEIALVDSQRRFGNKHCLPAGPLREPLSRLKTVDFIVYNGAHESASSQMLLQMQHCINLVTGEKRPLQAFHHSEVHAVAAIGHPKRFFDQLAEQQLIVHPHHFPDHHVFTAKDLAFSEQLPILMTEKDAVKCTDFAQASMWFVPVQAVLTPELINNILIRLNRGPTHG